jgi:hypothetical protein
MLSWARCPKTQSLWRPAPADSLCSFICNLCSVGYPEKSTELDTDLFCTEVTGLHNRLTVILWIRRSIGGPRHPPIQI